MPLGLLEETIVENPCCEVWPKLACLWNYPLLNPNAANNEVHVWRIRLDLSVKKIQQLARTLSPDEQLKADGFHFNRHRRQYIASHGSLRMILSKYLGPAPSQLQFTYSSRGKPSLVSNGIAEPLCFNLSNSNELALCAVTLNRAIGIDIEYIRPKIDNKSLSKHFFSTQENKLINSFPHEERQDIFLNLWTLKEAYLKATGEGIKGLENIEISISHREQPVIHSINGMIQTKRRWSIIQLFPERGYTAGLAVEGSIDHNYCFYNFVV